MSMADKIIAARDAVKELAEAADGDFQISSLEWERRYALRFALQYLNAALKEEGAIRYREKLAKEYA